MSKASSAAMEALHGLLAKEMADILSNGVNVVDKDTGKVERVTPGANFLNVIRQFLKDNNIEAPSLPATPDGFKKFTAPALPYLRKDIGDESDAPNL